jgi:hypothetical protein
VFNCLEILQRIAPSKKVATGNPASKSQGETKRVGPHPTVI